VANLLSVLAKGQSKLATPGWPKFTDSYRSFYPVLHNQMQGGHGGGIFPNWQKEKQQASMVKQQSKEDVDIGEMHVQGPFTFSSGDLSRKRDLSNFFW
jgi:hypothetical protein